MPRYSDDYNVDQACIAIISCMDPDGPFAWSRSSQPVKTGTMSIAEVIARIRFQYGDAAAASIRIVVH